MTWRSERSRRSVPRGPRKYFWVDDVRGGGRPGDRELDAELLEHHRAVAVVDDAGIAQLPLEGVVYRVVLACETARDGRCARMLDCGHRGELLGWTPARRSGAMDGRTRVVGREPTVRAAGSPTGGPTPRRCDPGISGCAPTTVPTTHVTPSRPDATELALWDERGKACGLLCRTVRAPPLPTPLPPRVVVGEPALKADSTRFVTAIMNVAASRCVPLSTRSGQPCGEDSGH